MDATVWMAESEVEVSYGNNSMDDRERGGSQLWKQQYGWQKESWKSVVETTVRMAEIEVEVSSGHNSTDDRERGGSQLWTQQYG